MARAAVQAGVCGHSAVVEVTRVDATHVRVVLHSACDQLLAMNPDLAHLQWRGKGHEVFKRMTESAVYQSAAQHIRHTACPIPAAILKAIEVEVGIALPQDVTISFLNDAHTQAAEPQAPAQPAVAASARAAQPDGAIDDRSRSDEG